MEFKQIFHKPMAEEQLLNLLVKDIQFNYLEYQDKCYFIKLEKTSEELSKAIWLKSFSNVYDLGEFFYDTKFHRCCVQLKFEEDRYEILFQGFHFSDRFKIWKNRISKRWPSKLTFNREEHLRLPQELIEKGLQDIVKALKND